ncbi:hypothetical protein D3C75_1000430 [compost metagenome]
MQSHQIFVSCYNMFAAFQRFQNVRFRLINPTHNFDDYIDIGVSNNFPRVFCKLCTINGNNAIFLCILYSNLLNNNGRADLTAQILLVPLYDANDSCTYSSQTQQSYFYWFH